MAYSSILVVRPCKIVAAALFALLLAGCLRTYIEPVQIDSTVQSLALANDEPLFVSVFPLEEHRTVGHQYLFFAIPFGRVTIKSLPQDIFKAAFSQLSLVGIKPILASTTTKKQLPHLRIEIREVQATAYDFFFMRWIKTRVILEAEYQDRSGLKRSLLLSGGQSSWKQFAFSKHLSFYFNRALNEALDPLPDLIGSAHAVKRD